MINILSPPVEGVFAPPEPVFTLGSALLWLGHDCLARCCSGPIEAMTASVWFLRRAGQLIYPLTTVVLVETAAFNGSFGKLRDVISSVNRCAGADSISVRPRDGGLPLGWCGSIR